MAEYADLRAELRARQEAMGAAAEKLDKLKLVVDPTHPEAMAAHDEYEAAQSALSSLYGEVRIYEK